MSQRNRSAAEGCVSWVVHLVAGMLLIAVGSQCGGADGEDCEPLDFYAEHYAACAEACRAADQYAYVCGLGEVDREACVEAAWHMGYAPHECEEDSTACFEAKMTVGECDIDSALHPSGAPRRFVPCHVGG